MVLRVRGRGTGEVASVQGRPWALNRQTLVEPLLGKFACLVLFRSQVGSCTDAGAFGRSGRSRVWWLMTLIVPIFMVTMIVIGMVKHGLVRLQMH